MFSRSIFFILCALLLLLTMLTFRSLLIISGPLPICSFFLFVRSSRANLWSLFFDSSLFEYYINNGAAHCLPPRGRPSEVISFPRINCRMHEAARREEERKTSALAARDVRIKQMNEDAAAGLGSRERTILFERCGIM